MVNYNCRLPSECKTKYDTHKRGDRKWSYRIEMADAHLWLRLKHVGLHTTVYILSFSDAEFYLNFWLCRMASQVSWPSFSRLFSLWIFKSHSLGLESWRKASWVQLETLLKVYSDLLRLVSENCYRCALHVRESTMRWNSLRMGRLY
jgi:hypothetical protein